MLGELPAVSDFQPFLSSSDTAPINYFYPSCRETSASSLGNPFLSSSDSNCSISDGSKTTKTKGNSHKNSRRSSLSRRKPPRRSASLLTTAVTGDLTSSSSRYSFYSSGLASVGSNSRPNSGSGVLDPQGLFESSALLNSISARARDLSLNRGQGLHVIEENKIKNKNSFNSFANSKSVRRDFTYQLNSNSSLNPLSEFGYFKNNGNGFYDGYCQPILTDFLSGNSVTQKSCPSNGYPYGSLPLSLETEPRSDLMGSLDSVSQLVGECSTGEHQILNHSINNNNSIDVSEGSNNNVKLINNNNQIDNSNFWFDGSHSAAESASQSISENCNQQAPSSEICSLQVFNRHQDRILNPEANYNNNYEYSCGSYSSYNDNNQGNSQSQSCASSQVWHTLNKNICNRDVNDGSSDNIEQHDDANVNPENPIQDFRDYRERRLSISDNFLADTSRNDCQIPTNAPGRSPPVLTQQTQINERDYADCPVNNFSSDKGSNVLSPDGNSNNINFSQLYSVMDQTVGNNNNGGPSYLLGSYNNNKIDPNYNKNNSFNNINNTNDEENVNQSQILSEEYQTSMFSKSQNPIAKCSSTPLQPVSENLLDFDFDIPPNNNKNNNRNSISGRESERVNYSSPLNSSASTSAGSGSHQGSSGAPVYQSGEDTDMPSRATRSQSMRYLRSSLQDELANEPKSKLSRTRHSENGTGTTEPNNKRRYSQSSMQQNNNKQKNKNKIFLSPSSPRGSSSCAATRSKTRMGSSPSPPSPSSSIANPKFFSNSLSKFTFSDENGKRKIRNDIMALAEQLPALPGLYFDKKQKGFRVRYQNVYVGWVALSRYHSIEEAYTSAREIWENAKLHAEKFHTPHAAVIASIPLQKEAQASGKNRGGRPRTVTQLPPSPSEWIGSAAGCWTGPSPTGGQTLAASSRGGSFGYDATYNRTGDVSGCGMGILSSGFASASSLGLSGSHGSDDMGSGLQTRMDETERFDASYGGRGGMRDLGSSNSQMRDHLSGNVSEGLCRVPDSSSYDENSEMINSNENNNNRGEVEVKYEDVGQQVLISTNNKNDNDEFYIQNNNNLIREENIRSSNSCSADQSSSYDSCDSNHLNSRSINSNFNENINNNIDNNKDNVDEFSSRFPVSNSLEPSTRGVYGTDRYQLPSSHAPGEFWQNYMYNNRTGEDAETQLRKSELLLRSMMKSKLDEVDNNYFHSSTGGSVTKCHVQNFPNSSTPLTNAAVEGAPNGQYSSTRTNSNSYYPGTSGAQSMNTNIPNKLGASGTNLENCGSGNQFHLINPRISFFAVNSSAISKSAPVGPIPVDNINADFVPPIQPSKELCKGEDAEQDRKKRRRTEF